MIAYWIIPIIIWILMFKNSFVFSLSFFFFYLYNIIYKLKHTDVKNSLCLQTDERNEIFSRMQRTVFIFDRVRDLLSLMAEKNNNNNTEHWYLFNHGNIF